LVFGRFVLLGEAYADSTETTRGTLAVASRRIPSSIGTPGQPGQRRLWAWARKRVVRDYRRAIGQPSEKQFRRSPAPGEMRPRLRSAPNIRPNASIWSRPRGPSGCSDVGAEPPVAV